LNVPEEDARIAADVLVEADLRGIDSHGVARLRPLYVNELRLGQIVARPQVRVVIETPTTAVLDAGAGLGHPVSYRAMQKAIQKAHEWGAGFVTLRNSRHYGIAGYYATLALEVDCIGISMTNSSPLVTPTFGRDAMLGSNPIAVAVPAGQEWPFVLDMATSVVAEGKLEVYDRLGQSLPGGWVVDAEARPMADAARALDARRRGAAGGLLPLGGAGELRGGHKGYGLALWVEVFCALLSGAPSPYKSSSTASHGDPRPYQVSHFFGAWLVERFRPLGEFKAAMDVLQRYLKGGPRAAGQTRIYVHGEKEFEEKDRRSQHGIPLNPKVLSDLQSLADELEIAYDL
jgi:LDH2 family malate/lactate/ureidoglycolate dehydrogenase